MRRLRLTARFERKWQDLWVGAYWKRGKGWSPGSGTVWICFVPCFPLRVDWWLVSR